MPIFPDIDFPKSLPSLEISSTTRPVLSDEFRISQHRACSSTATIMRSNKSPSNDHSTSSTPKTAASSCSEEPSPAVPHVSTSDEFLGFRADEFPTSFQVEVLFDRVPDGADSAICVPKCSAQSSLSSFSCAAFPDSACHVLVLLPDAEAVRRMRRCNDSSAAEALSSPGAMMAADGRMLERSFVYHVLTDAAWSLADWLSLDALAFLQNCTSYVQFLNNMSSTRRAASRGATEQTEKMIRGVFAFDCFPALLAAVINKNFGLPGPSLASVLLCDHKLLTRKFLTPSVPLYDGAALLAEARKWRANSEKIPAHYPVVIKIAGAQYCRATTICEDPAGFLEAVTRNELLLCVFDPDHCLCEEIPDCLQAFRRRQKFYEKCCAEAGLEVGADGAVPLVHVEAGFDVKSEHQAEIVMFGKEGENLQCFVADTGDITRAKDALEKNVTGVAAELITSFKTPGSFHLSQNFKTWLTPILDKLKTHGMRNSALDVEFVRCSHHGGAAEENWQLIELNARYSFMGWGQIEPVEKASPTPEPTGDKTWPLAQTLRESEAVLPLVRETPDVRNLLNHAFLCIGEAPVTVPARDEIGIAKLTVYMYTTMLGHEDDFVDKDATQRRIGLGIEDYVGKHLHGHGGKGVDENDRVVPGGGVEERVGWAKHGFYFLTLKDDNPALNRFLHSLCASVFNKGEYIRVVIPSAASVPPDYRSLSS